MAFGATIKVQDICDAARAPLNDNAKDRWPDQDTVDPATNNTKVGLLTYVQEAILMLRQKRPDLFIGQFDNLPQVVALTDAFPLPNEYAPIVARAVTFSAEIRDDEFSNSERAAMMQKMLELELS